MKISKLNALSGTSGPLFTADNEAPEAARDRRMADAIIGSLSTAAKTALVGVIRRYGRGTRKSRRATAAIIKADAKATVRRERALAALGDVRARERADQAERMVRRFESGNFEPLPGMTEEHLEALGLERMGDAFGMDRHESAIDLDAPMHTPTELSAEDLNTSGDFEIKDSTGYPF